jgi:hypothetical protein
MIQIQSTQKLLTFYKIKSEDSCSEDGFFKWHLSVFEIDGSKCLFIMNDKYFFPFMIYDVSGKEDLEALIKGEMKKALIHQYASREQIERYLEEPIMFTKTMDKKIQGKSSSIIKEIPYRFYEVDEDYNKLNLHLPSSEIEYNPKTELFDDSGDMFVRELNDRMPDIKKDMAQITEAALQTWEKLSIRTKDVFLNELLHCYDHNDGFEFHEIIDRKHSFFIVGTCNHCGKKEFKVIPKDEMVEIMKISAQESE